MVGCLFPPRVAAQQTTPRGAGIVGYVELGGNVLWPGSLNLEVMLTPELAVRVGAAPGAAFPLMLNYLQGRGPHRAELGLGVLLGAGEDVYGTGTIGYRYQPRDGGLVLRAGITPLLDNGAVAPWAGLSIGISFGPPTPSDPGGADPRFNY